MAAHASQITEDSIFLALPDDAFAMAFGQEWYVHYGSSQQGEPYLDDIFDVLDVDVRCACGLDVGPRQYGTNPGGALPCEPNTVRSRVTTSTYKGINPELWHHPSGRRGPETR